MGKRKIKRIKRRVLDSLKEKAPLSTNKGVYDKSIKRKPTTKQRRHRGWRTPRIPQPIKYSEMIENAWEPKIEYDDWLDYRDGMRNTSDRTHFIPKINWCLNIDEEEIKKRNDKLKKLIKIKEAMRKSKK